MLGSYDPSGAVSTSTYDGFGRLIETRDPDPVTGLPNVAPSLVVQRFRFGGPGAPVQKTRIGRRLGEARSYTTWSYTDGFGRELLTLRQADPAAGDAGAWIATGLPDVSWDGLPTMLYAPWFYSGDPATHPLAPPNPPSVTVNFDSFGRVTEVRRPDGSLAGKRTYHPLRIDSEGRRRPLAQRAR